MESFSAFVVWLHDQGYQFTGPSAISALTYEELLLLQLGYLIQQEQQERRQQGGGSAGRRKYSKPATPTTEAMREYAAKRN